MRKIMVSLLLVMSMALPVFVSAQETPSAEVPTLEPTLFVTDVPTDVPTLEPTAEPTEEPVPVPDPSPIDDAAIPAWVFTIVVVLAVGIISIAIVAIIQAAKSWPPAAKELLLSLLNTGVGELDKVAKGTETDIDDVAIVELRKRVAELEAAMRAVPARTEAIAQAVVNQNK